MNRILDKLRAAPWLVGALIATAIVAILAPFQIGVLVWSLCKLCVGAYLGYWIDRSIFPYARPHTLMDPGSSRGYLAQTAMLRRAIIIAAVIVGLAVGV